MAAASVELVTEFVEKPLLLARCSRACPLVYTRDTDATADLNQNLQTFLKTAGEEGWSISLLGNLCPNHLAQLREVMQAQQSRIIAPNSGGIVRLN